MTPMLLHEAIRLGAMDTPQAFGKAFDGRGTCAAGAALHAIGRLHARAATDYGQYWSVWHKVQNAPCPACGTTSDNRSKTIPHLNDEHRWTREQVADWVQTIECPAPDPYTAEDVIAAIQAERGQP